MTRYRKDTRFSGLSEALRAIDQALLDWRGDARALGLACARRMVRDLARAALIDAKKRERKTT